MNRDHSRAWLLLLGFLASGCNPPKEELPRLHVAAASDLQSAMPILASSFRLEHEVEIVPTFGASGQLAEQIRQGAPFDIFLSANRAFIDRLASEGHLRKDSIQPYTRGSLVLLVDRIVKVEITSLEDLKRTEIKKIAIANTETAPYGMAAKQALERSGLWEILKPKIVPTESVAQALQMVRTGNAEAALVGRSLAESGEFEIVSIPPDLYDPIIQYLGIVSRTTRGDDARAFSGFVLGETGQGILIQLGFRGLKQPNREKAKATP